MTLITIVFALIIEYFVGSLADLRRFGWFRRFASGVGNKLGGKDFWGGIGGAILVLAAWLVPLYLLFAWLSGLSLVVAFLLSLAVLLYCLGPRSFYGLAEEFCTAHQAGDQERAVWLAEQLLERPLSEAERERLLQTVTEGMFVAANERLFGVLFWFALLGPIGAVLFRLSSQFRMWAGEGEKSEAAARLAASALRVHNAIAWLPAQLMAASFALMGNFAAAMKSCCQGDADCRARWSTESEGRVACVGQGALAGVAVAEGEEPLAARSLVSRSLALWVAAIALLSLLLALI